MNRAGGVWQVAIGSQRGGQPGQQENQQPADDRSENPENRPGNLDARLRQLLEEVEREGALDGPGDRHWPDFPGFEFAWETAWNDLRSGGNRILFSSPFVSGERGIPINGLIWMGSKAEMLDRVRTKLDTRFKVLKFRTGALDMEDELSLLRELRTRFAPEDLEIRLDANGAWTPEEAPRILASFARYGIHSIEQPLAAGRPDHGPAQPHGDHPPGPR
ncbi:MAG: enolase C-terminal domain-like protein [Bacteroidales bacterium]